MPDQPGALSWWMMTLGLLVLVSVLMRNVTRYFRRREKGWSVSPASSATETRTDRASLETADWSRWYVESHDLARDMKAELDSKMLALQALIRLAQEHEARLASLLEQARQG